MHDDKETQKEIWDAIASSWHSFRQKPHPQILLVLKKYAEQWKIGKILEIGCGNCRNMIPFEYNGFDCYGIDFSEEMLKHAMDYGKKHKLKIKIKQAHSTSLPFEKNYFDYVLCISMLHNLDAAGREKTLREIKRILKPNGRAIIVVWNKLQWKFLFKKNNIEMPWHIGEKVYQRYYHLFTAWSLKKLLLKENFKIHESNVFGPNLIFIVQ
ncbi:MAG: class I SAM-dependent methyltransferase [archaeon]